MNEAFLSLGSNEGDRVLWINKAIRLIQVNCGEIISQSSLYQTAAWGITAQPDFLNRVVKIQTSLNPHQLLTAILNIETTLGRHREVKWGPRIIDIDILFYNSDIINTPELTVPHPFLHERRFTLIPLMEIDPGYIHPGLHKTIATLLSECEDKLEVHRFEAGA